MKSQVRRLDDILTTLNRIRGDLTRLTRHHPDDAARQAFHGALGTVQSLTQQLARYRNQLFFAGEPVMAERTRDSEGNS